MAIDFSSPKLGLQGGGGLIPRIIQYQEVTTVTHITKTNGMHEPHIHPGCSWCGIYYIQSGDNDSGHTVFENPIKSTYIDHGNLFLNNMNIVRIKPEDGMLVVFPSCLNHYQALYEGVEDRIVVAFNSTINKLGEED